MNYLIKLIIVSNGCFFFKQKNSWILTDFFHFLFFYIIFHIQIKCIDLLSKNPYIFSTASNSLQELLPKHFNPS